MSAITTSSIYNSSSTNCKDLERVGFASHPTCYVDNGFCTDILTSSTNLVCLGKDVLEFRDFFNKLAVNQVSILDELLAIFVFIIHIGLQDSCLMCTRSH